MYLKNDCLPSKHLIDIISNPKNIFNSSSTAYNSTPDDIFVIATISRDSLQVISFIANGAFGKVFKVLDRKSHKLYAMKILQKSRVSFFQLLYLQISTKSLREVLLLDN